MTFWSVARGQIAAGVRLTMNYLECSTDVARLLWVTQEVHSGKIVHGAHLPSLPQRLVWKSLTLPFWVSTLRTSHKPEGLSAVIDERHEHVCGKWASEKGESSIFWDCNMNCLSFEEPVDDSGCLHGWLDRNRDGWQARLASYDMDEEPWYSPSCGEEPEYVGDIHVRLLSETAIETQIKFLMTMSGSRQ